MEIFGCATRPPAFVACGPGAAADACSCYAGAGAAVTARVYGAFNTFCQFIADIDDKGRELAERGAEVRARAGDQTDVQQLKQEEERGRRVKLLNAVNREVDTID